jgi:hypothetical protein
MAHCWEGERTDKAILSRKYFKRQKELATAGTWYRSLTAFGKHV